MTLGRAVVLGALALVTAACGGQAATNPPPAAPSTALGTRTTGEGRPALTVVAREGDARGAVAVAVTTEGIAPERGALVGVALAALVEGRLAARGVADASVVGSWDGWRLRALVSSAADAAKLVDAVRAALLAPVAAGDPALATVTRKVAALAHRPLADRVLVDVARCTGEAFGLPGDAAPTVDELERWRRAAHGLGRVAIATAGDASLADAAAGTLAHGAAWPKASAVQTVPWPTADARTVVYDASGELPPGAARIVVTARTATPERAVATAPVLGDARGPLASRLAALDAPARVRSVVATAHGEGGCLAASVDLGARDLAVDPARRIATAAALARQEVAVQVADTTAPADLGRQLATRAADPRDAAERAAWWSLSGRRAGHADALGLSLTVGVAAARDAAAPTAASQADTIRAEIDRATMAWHSPVVEARTHVERGQGEAWVLLASTCGTGPEAEGDAGSGAEVATAAAAQGAAGSDVRVESFVAADGIGVLAHGAARTGESPQAHARRLADAAARAFAADALDPRYVQDARKGLLARAADTPERLLGALGGAIALGHPSWVDPLGTRFGLASSSDEAVALRAAAIRGGPLRVAVLANVDAEQADAAVRSIDRWIARRPGEARACPSLPSVVAPRAGTYAVDLPAGAPSEAILALPLPPGDDAAYAAATWTAAILDGPDGLLAHALGSSRAGAPEAALARSWSAAVLGAPRSPVLAVHLVSADASLDDAVAQTRALLDHLRQGALRDEDRTHAAASLARAALASSLDPRARTVELWRGRASSAAPSLEALRAFAASTLHDDALVIVAARPRRIEPPTRSVPARDPKVKSREQGSH